MPPYISVSLRRGVVATLCVLLSVLSVGAAPARVSGSHAENQNDTSASARTLAYGGTLTAGSLLTVTVVTFNASITVTVADGTNGSYTQAGSYSTGPSSSIIVSQWYFPNNAATGTPTVTVTPSAAAYMSISLDEWTGIATSSPVRATGTNQTSSNATQVTSTVTATAGDLVLASMHSDAVGVTASTVTAPFTLSTNLGSTASFSGIVTAYDLAAAGNEAATFNMSGSTNGAKVIVSYIPAASGSPSGSLLGVGK